MALKTVTSCLNSRINRANECRDSRNDRIVDHGQRHKKREAETQVNPAPSRNRNDLNQGHGQGPENQLANQGPPEEIDMAEHKQGATNESWNDDDQLKDQEPALRSSPAHKCHLVAPESIREVCGKWPSWVRQSTYPECGACPPVG